MSNYKLTGISTVLGVGNEFARSKIISLLLVMQLLVSIEISGGTIRKVSYSSRTLNATRKIVKCMFTYLMVITDLLPIPFCR
jgi:hypothetical protein